MSESNKRLKALALSLGLVLGMTELAYAQYDVGLLGYGRGAKQQNREGMFRYGAYQGGYNLYNQQFGDEDGNEDEDATYNLYNQIFGQNVPLGNGWLVLTMAGAGYAFRKAKNTNKKKS